MMAIGATPWSEELFPLKLYGPSREPARDYDTLHTISASVHEEEPESGWRPYCTSCIAPGYI